MEDKKLQDDFNDDVENSTNETDKNEKKVEGSGIFTVDGKELPKIEGGYTGYSGGGTLGENELK